MKSTTERVFRVSRFPVSSGACDYVAQVAVKLNGRPEEDRIGLDSLIGYLEVEKIQFPHSNSGMVISKIDDYHLCVDIDGKPALEIIEVDMIKVIVEESDETDTDDNDLLNYPHSAN
jgi:hypothetical protein